jgi:hypothetical protein
MPNQSNEAKPDDVMKKSVLFLVLITLGVTSQSLFAREIVPTPDGGTTAALLTVGVGGLIWARRFFRR